MSIVLPWLLRYATPAHPDTPAYYKHGFGDPTVIFACDTQDEAKRKLAKAEQIIKELRVQLTES